LRLSGKSHRRQFWQARPAPAAPCGGGSRALEVLVQLCGAAPNAVYQVFFQQFNSIGRTNLGTDNSGNMNARTWSESGGTARVGIFVITRSSDGSGQAGKDECISSLGG